MKFLDEAKIHIRSGAGGAGCVSFRREKYVERGGPDGGDGGRGGDIVAECVAGLNTLIDYRYRQHFAAGTGGHGQGRGKSGARGNDRIVKVPEGTQIFAEDKTTLIADLTETGQRVVLAPGGNGGFGNQRFKSAVARAPRHANPGQEGREAWIWLKLKLIADIGFIGQPNAGKSTLLARLSRARPKIADYPFTTLHPHLGVMRTPERDIVAADIPGLIAGAAEGAGLGHRFLGHIERCAALVHLIDATDDNPLESWKTVRKELAAYSDAMTDKPEIVVLTKCDITTDDDIMTRRDALAAEVGETHLVSAISGAGLDALTQRIGDFVRQNTMPEAVKSAAQNWHPMDGR